MKLAFISDIHANLEALNAVLKDIKKREIEKIYCLGDLVGYGPNPNEVIDIIKKEKIESVMGNYDNAIGYEKESCGCAYNPGRETEVGDESINWTIKNTTKKNKKYLKSLSSKIELKIEGINLLLVHGSPLNHLFEYIKPDIDILRLKEIVNKTNADIIITGHTHLIMSKHIKGKAILNPGSIGRTKDGSPLATYLILEINNGIYNYEFIKVKYDVKKTVEKIIEVGLPVELATVLALGGTFNMGKSKNNNMIFKVNK
ncbi:metallophosphatase [Marinitoga sp. 1154]|uniref:metallophosphoesterase family protein n=1 Tax=Marinitoga sp. 1154 TaxID=1643335 RepID=UPI001585F95C|nr:metallophosphoesterase family protein [Marinitoga sp. 1154]NUV00168.1 metallophosphatase [Marinitoga sp. 1154]